MAELFPDHWKCYLNKREENEICSWLKQSNSIYNEKRGSCTGSPHPIPARQMQGSHLAKLLLVPPGTLLTLSSHSLSMSLAGTLSGPIVGLPLAGTVGVVGGTFCCVDCSSTARRTVSIPVPTPTQSGGTAGDMRKVCLNVLLGGWCLPSVESLYRLLTLV